MRVLVLGGTGLAGSAIVDEAVRRGHEVVSVHRGRSLGNPGARQIVLDRVADGHGSLAGDSWDAVIDVSGYVPAVVRDALHAVGSATTRWVFLSSVSVFRAFAEVGQDERAPVIEIDDAVRREALDDPAFDWRSTGLYGACKVLCEEKVASADLASAAILRPCVVAGANDGTWRYPYWVKRAGRGGHMVAPEPRRAPVAVVDARDLAAFALRCAEEAISDTFVIAPDPFEATMEALVDGARSAWPDVDLQIEWIHERAVLASGVEPWAGLPFWLPSAHEQPGFNSFDASRARAAGFASRPLRDTALEVRRWLESGATLPDRAGTLTPAAEAQIIAGAHATR